jgi:hypothetical protein
MIGGAWQLHGPIGAVGSGSMKIPKVNETKIDK